MWQWTLNWNEIRADLVVGSCPMQPEDIGRIIEETGIDAILSLQSDECRAAFAIDYAAHRAFGEERGLLMVNTPMLDFDPPDQRRNLASAVKALTALVIDGRHTYVHCTAGINRAPLVVLAYLTFVERLPMEAAMELVRRRPGAEPCWEAYHGAREDLVAALSEMARVRAYYLSQEHPENDEMRNWFEAEGEVIRSAFLSPAPLAGARRDPHRQ